MSGVVYLVDSGAQVSVFPHASRQRPRSFLLAADGRQIPAWNTVSLPVTLGGRQFGLHRFIHAAVDQPILGADFFTRTGLLIDLKNRRLLPPSSSPSPSPSPPPPPSLPTVAKLSTPPEFQKLLSEFPAVTNKDGVRFAGSPAHGVRHHIVTKGPPVFSKARQLDPAKLAAAKEEFAAMEQAGIIRRADGPWASPLHLVPKPDGSWRPTGDYRRLNNATVPDRYPLPNIRDFTANLHGRKVFSKIDLVKGYYQVPMHPDDVCKTAVVTPFGLFEWLVMPFGVRNAANTFQRMMDRALHGLPCAFVYLDDVLVASSSFDDHLVDVRAVLTRLQEFGLVINPDKSYFCQDSVEFLGHTVTATGISPLEKHAAAISSFAAPASKKDLQRFLGLLNFYRRFLPGVAGLLKPLTDALRGPPRSPLVWTPECETAFVAARRCLSAKMELFHPDPSAELSVAVDASSTHVGAVLQQAGGAGTQPLSFFSRKLSSAQSKYSAFDRELLAAFSAVRHWRHLLEGRRFKLLTDHKPLPAAIKRASQPWSARQQRQLSYLSEFDLEFVHLPGDENVVADALSRPPPASVLPDLASLAVSPDCAGVNFKRMAELQKKCPEVAQLASSPSLHVMEIVVGGESLMCDVSTGVPRPLVPVAMRQAVFTVLHNLSHPGRRASARLVSSRFVWRGMAREVRSWAAQCVPCQKSKVSRHVTAPILHVPVPEVPFSALNLDIVGPLPVSSGMKYLLTVVDRTTRWPEAIPVSDVTTTTLATAFIAGWVSRFGVPAVLTSDRGAQFTSVFWSELCRLLGIDHNTTTAYRPQANGLVERFHRRLKESLRARLAGADWLSHLPWVLLGLRTAPREDSGTSPAQHALGTALLVPGQLLQPDGPPPDVHRHLSGLPPLPTRHNRQSLDRGVAQLHDASFVYIRDDRPTKPALAPLYTGPFRVVDRADSHFTVEVGDKLERVNVHRLKPAVVPDDTVPFVPRKRGRPVRVDRTAPDPPVCPPRCSLSRPPKSMAPTALPSRAHLGRAAKKKVTFVMK